MCLRQAGSQSLSQPNEISCLPLTIDVIQLEHRQQQYSLITNWKLFIHHQQQTIAGVWGKFGGHTSADSRDGYLCGRHTELTKGVTAKRMPMN